VSAPAAFYFDLSSPDAYLAAERVLQVLPGPAEWQPVLTSEMRPERPATQPHEDGADLRERIAVRARELNLQPVRWPDPFPFDSTMAMRVATYAKSIGRVVPFAQAAFRQAFAGGHGLDDPNYVLIAAAACEMHPAAVLRGAELRSVERQLSEATERAVRTGINAVPAVVVADRTFCGECALEDAAAHMRETS
jgi:2-hydroxychromene-2-carboxylate isomerase